MHFPQSLSSHLSREKKAYSVGLHGPSILFNASFSFVTGKKREELLKSFTSVICVKVCLFHRSENHASLRFSIKVWWLEEHERMLIPNGTSSCPAPLPDAPSSFFFYFRVSMMPQNECSSAHYAAVRWAEIERRIKAECISHLKADL